MLMFNLFKFFALILRICDARISNSFYINFNDGLINSMCILLVLYHSC